jgi:transcriptional regulator with XRE-family HTH domain
MFITESITPPKPDVNTLRIRRGIKLSGMRWQDRFRLFMESRQLTQTEIAKRLNMTQGAIGHWLSGRREISLGEFFRLCQSVGANPQSVLFGEPAANDLLGKIKQLIETEPEKESSYQQFEKKLKNAPKVKKP